MQQVGSEASVVPLPPTPGLSRVLPLTEADSCRGPVYKNTSVHTQGGGLCTLGHGRCSCPPFHAGQRTEGTCLLQPQDRGPPRSPHAAIVVVTKPQQSEAQSVPPKGPSPRRWLVDRTLRWQGREPVLAQAPGLHWGQGLRALGGAWSQAGPGGKVTALWPQDTGLRPSSDHPHPNLGPEAQLPSRPQPPRGAGGTSRAHQVQEAVSGPGRARPPSWTTGHHKQLFVCGETRSPSKGPPTNLNEGGGQPLPKAPERLRYPGQLWPGAQRAPAGPPPQGRPLPQPSPPRPRPSAPARASPAGGPLPQGQGGARGRPAPPARAAPALPAQAALGHFLLPRLHSGCAARARPRRPGTKRRHGEEIRALAAAAAGGTHRALRPGEHRPSRAAASGARRSTSPRAGPGAGWAARTRGGRCRASLARGPVLVRGRARVPRCLLRARWAGRCSVPPPPARPAPAPRAPPGRPPTSASAARRPHPGGEGGGRDGGRPTGRAPPGLSRASPRPRPPWTQFPSLSREPHDSAPLWRGRNESRLCLLGLGLGCRRLQSSLTPECAPSGSPRWGPGTERPELSAETQSEDPAPRCGGGDSGLRWACGAGGRIADLLRGDAVEAPV